MCKTIVVSVLIIFFGMLLTSTICQRIFEPSKSICRLASEHRTCPAGSYIDRNCGKTCYRLPDESCDMSLDAKQIYGTCHPRLTCACGKCVGCLSLPDGNICDRRDNMPCPSSKKDMYTKKHSNLFNSEYYY